MGGSDALRCGTMMSRNKCSHLQGDRRPFGGDKADGGCGERPGAGIVGCCGLAVVTDRYVGGASSPPVPMCSWSMLAGRAAAAWFISWWNFIASVTMPVTSSGSATSVVRSSPPTPPSMHAYSGSSWCSDGRLRANSVRLIESGPMPGRTPLMSWSMARAAPRVGGAEGYDLSGAFGAVFALDVALGDQAAHRVGDEHQFRIGVGAALGAPVVVCAVGGLCEAAGVVAVGQPPVVGKQDEVAGWGAGFGALPAVAQTFDAFDQAAIALDRGPDAGQGMDVGHEAGGFDTVVGVLVADAIGELEILDVAGEVSDQLDEPAEGR